MALKDRFFEDAYIGSPVKLTIESKEIIGRIVLLDALSSVPLVKLKLRNSKIQTIKVKEIKYYNVISEKKFFEIESSRLIFKADFWSNNIEELSTKKLKERFNALNLPKELLEKINGIMNSLKNCLQQPKGFEPNSDNVRKIMYNTKKLCEKYKKSVLYELLAIFLINLEQTYKEYFKKECPDEYCSKVIYFGDAVICCERKKYEEMVDYCEKFFSVTKITETQIHFNNFLLILPYLFKNGKMKLIQDKKREIENLSIEKKSAFNDAYNKLKIQQSQHSLNDDGKDSNFNMKKNNNESEVSSEEIFKEFRGEIINLISKGEYSKATKSIKKNFDKEFENKELTDLLEYIYEFKDLIYKGSFFKAIKLTREKFGEKPENEEVYNLLKYIERVREKKQNYKYSSKTKQRLKPSHLKALEEWRIYENTEAAINYFLSSINAGDAEAIRHYADCIRDKVGLKEAIEKLEIYAKTGRLDLTYRIKCYEKLNSFYLDDKNYKNSIECLNSLKNLYTEKIKLYKDIYMKEIEKKYQEKFNSTIFRIGTSQKLQGEYKQSIKTTMEAMSRGYNQHRCIRQIFYCFIETKNYQSAREIVYKYKSKIPDFDSLLRTIKTYESKDSEAGTNKLSRDSDWLENKFVNCYEKECIYRGIRKKSRKLENFSKYDLENIKRKIISTDEYRFKDKSDYYLTAACIEKSLYEKSKEYYEFISKSMLYKGHLLLKNNEFEIAKGYYLTVTAMSSKFEGLEIEETAICGYLCCSLKKLKEEDIFEKKSFDTKIKSLISDIMETNDENSDKNMMLRDIVRLLKISQSLMKLFDENKEEKIYKSLLDEIIKYLDCENIEQIETKINEKYQEEKKMFKDWYSKVELDRNFEHDNSEIAKVKKGILVTSLDIEYIEDYLKYCKYICEMEYSDYNSPVVLKRGLDDIKELIDKGKKNPTLFFKNYLYKIINETNKNLKKLFDSTNENYKPKLEIEVPETNIPEINGHVGLSVTIKNQKNKAPAKNITLSVMDVKGNEMTTERISKKLEGGDEDYKIINILSKGEKAFTVDIKLDYTDGQGNSYIEKKTISISTDANFEVIKNPYIVGKVISNNKMFFGREELIKKLSNKLNDNTASCIIIHGQKRSGKSSILYHLKEKMRKINRFIILDFTVGDDPYNEKNFYEDVKSGFIEYLEDNDYKGNIEIFQKFEINDSFDLKNFLRKVKKFITQEEKKELLLLIDEFTNIYDYIKKKHTFNENFMSNWKDMTERDFFKSVLVCQDAVIQDFINEYPHQFQIAERIPVTYLDTKYAIDLVTKPIAISGVKSRFLEESEKMIAEWFSGQPYYLQTYCVKLVDHINENEQQNYITKAIAKKVKDDMISNCRIDFFDNLVQKNEPEFMEVLCQIIKFSNKPKEVKIEDLELSSSQKEDLKKLITKGVIEKSDQKCWIKIPFFHEWIKKNVL